jgi:hypothetical protein
VSRRQLHYFSPDLRSESTLTLGWEGLVEGGDDEGGGALHPGTTQRSRQHAGGHWAQTDQRVRDCSGVAVAEEAVACELGKLCQRSLPTVELLFYYPLRRAHRSARS